MTISGTERSEVKPTTHEEGIGEPGVESKRSLDLFNLIRAELDVEGLNVGL